MKINKEIKDFAKLIHAKEHLFVGNKIDKNHKLEDYYYLMASFIFHKLGDKIEDKSIEIFNKIVDLESRFYNLEKELKEVSKQQKYLWQTLDDGKFQEENNHSSSLRNEANKSDGSQDIPTGSYSGSSEDICEKEEGKGK